MLQGDDGGPLVCLQGKSWVQVGVASQSSTCDMPGRPSVFVKTVFHEKWISEGTWLTFMMCIVWYPVAFTIISYWVCWKWLKNMCNIFIWRSKLLRNKHACTVFVNQKIAKVFKMA